MHGQRIVIDAREGCIHMGVHFYNTTEEIDRVLRIIDAGWLIADRRSRDRTTPQ